MRESTADKILQHCRLRPDFSPALVLVVVSFVCEHSPKRRFSGTQTDNRDTPKQAGRSTSLPSNRCPVESTQGKPLLCGWTLHSPVLPRGSWPCPNSAPKRTAEFSAKLGSCAWHRALTTKAARSIACLSPGGALEPSTAAASADSESLCRESHGLCAEADRGRSQLPTRETPLSAGRRKNLWPLTSGRDAGELLDADRLPGGYCPRLRDQQLLFSLSRQPFLCWRFASSVRERSVSGKRLVSRQLGQDWER